ncbi:MAG: protein kinase [Acidobacteria bacterium]|nr:protein kinase [Acidobacteriota bacterium]
MIGRTLAHFKVTDKLGEGGMGEVYRAEDTKLGREVAVKVLPEAFTRDPERLARFEREAQVLASLSHANIAGIHQVEEIEGTHFLVMELVEGKTLAERIARGAIPVDDVITIALQIAEALEAAHQKSIVHRDLKPANVMVTPDGTVKVLDFGLAKAREPEVSDADLTRSPTLTAQMTRAGVILGTAAYMSPEQARGEVLDQRADIWAFGAILYEMLVGRPAFSGDTVADILAAIIERDIEWAELPEATPWRIRELLRRCLQKDLRQRLHAIADARIELQEALSEPDEEMVEGAASSANFWERMRTAWWMLPAAIGVGLVAAWITWRLLEAPAGAPPGAVRVGVSMPPGVSIDADGLRPGVDLSPDGQWLVFVGTQDGKRMLFKRSLKRFELTPISGTENARSVFFSPDGSWVGFWDYSAGQIKKVALSGGVPQVLCDAPNAWGATWGPNGRIVFSRGDRSGLWAVSEAGGEPELLIPTDLEDGTTSFTMPTFLPDGGAVLYSSWRGGFTAASARIEVLDLASGETRVVTENAAAPRYLPSGHLIYGRGGRVEVAPFDLESRRIVGPSVPIPEPIFWDPGGVLHLAVSDAGTVAFVPGGHAPRRRLVYTNFQGGSEVVAGDPRGYEYARFSPDGQRLAVTISEFGESSIWILDVSSGLSTRLAGEGRRSLPLWNPDGRSVVFAAETSEPPSSWSIFRQQADGSSLPEPLLEAQQPGEWLWPLSWTPDGKVLVLTKWAVGSSKDIFYLSLDDDGGAEPRPFLTTEANELHGVLSPDGDWIAYASDETGHWAIYVQRFPEGGERHQVSAGDTLALAGWGPDGRRIYYEFEGRMMEVGIRTEPEFRAETPRALFEVSQYGGLWWSPDFHPSPDGEGFVMIAPDKTWGVATEIKVVLNWFEQLQELARPPR